MTNCAAMFPDAHISGLQHRRSDRNNDVTDDEIAAAAIGFDATSFRLACEPAPSPERSHACGDAIGRALAAPDLAGIFVLSDGLNVNGSELVAGITSVVGVGIPLTGGLAGDGAEFRETLVGADCAPRKHTSRRSDSTVRRCGSAMAAPAAGTSSDHAGK